MAGPIGNVIDGILDATIGVPPPTRRLLNEARTQHMLGRQLRGLLATPHIGLDFSRELSCGYDGIIRRERGGYRITTSRRTSRTNWRQVGHSGAAYLYWLSRCPPEVEQIWVSLCDGDRSTEGRFAGSTNMPDIVPLPDPYYFGNRGFIRFRQLSETVDVPWHERSDELVWRGATTGAGTSDPVIGALHPDMASERVLLCLALRGVPGTDVKFSTVSVEDLTLPYMVKHGIGDDYIAEESWIGRKFALDVDGQTNTWSNLLVRLHLGCCVLKVAGRYGFRQWYYDRLEPWEHYVPVRSDLSDLLERIEWVRSNDREAAEIARRGQAFARTLDWDAVAAEAVELITGNWNRPPQPAA